MAAGLRPDPLGELTALPIQSKWHKGAGERRDGAGERKGR